MTACTTKPIEITRCKGRDVQVNFNGGEITSNVGAILLNRADKKNRSNEKARPFINDSRCKGKINHKTEDMLWQRVYALSLGYEDLNDHAALRKDTAIQTVVGNDKDLASSSTLCRFEKMLQT
jgi:hypothetical protein